MVCLWTKKESSSVNPSPAILTEQALSTKDLPYGKRTLFSYGTHWVIPSGQNSPILLSWVANHSAGFISSYLLIELNILIIKMLVDFRCYRTAALIIPRVKIFQGFSNIKGQLNTILMIIIMVNLGKIHTGISIFKKF